MKKLIRSICLLISLIAAMTINSMAQKENAVRINRSAMHHEVQTDGYLAHPSKEIKTSPAYTWETPIFFTTQVNIDASGNNIVGDAANEPSIAVDPNDPNRMVIGWRQFDNVSSNFRQAGYAYTTDGGQTWTFPGVINPGVFRSDPVLDCDADGRFYYNSLTVDEWSNYSCNVYRNLPGGFIWDNGPFAQGGDKQWMVIDRTEGIGSGNIYSFWTTDYSVCIPGAFTRSTDGGDTYEDCVEVEGTPYWGNMAVGKNGELYLVGSGGWDGLTVVKSSNAQNPSSTVNWDFSAYVNIDGYLTGWTEINPAGLLGQANICVDVSDGPGSGNVYVLASVARSSVNDPADVMFARSTDGGITWDDPVRINDDLGISKYQWFGTMSISPDGRLDVVWLDNRDGIGGNYGSALYYSCSFDQGLTWTANEKLSESFNPHIGWPNQEKLGDYFDMESEEGSAHLSWANTLNGEQDVYYGHIILQFTGMGSEKGKQMLSLSNYPNPFRDVTTVR
ncbi:MAG: exo-alpha-sialidase [Bacteroidetes bacterium]|nr:exo-alpha-sialidase [Bacteroidota bacterium]